MFDEYDNILAEHGLYHDVFNNVYRDMIDNECESMIDEILCAEYDVMYDNFID
jgi:hypothetical protein